MMHKALINYHKNCRMQDSTEIEHQKECNMIEK